MVIEYRTPTEADWPEMVRADARSFGWVPTQEQIDERRPLVDLERFRIATDRGQVVGVSGAFGFDVTVPGGTTVPAAGVTWVAVSATHRRRGVLTELIGRVHAEADDRGEPIAMLFASEGGIYERFGYGIASAMRFVDIDRGAARLRPDLPIDLDAVRYVDGDAALDHLASVWDRYRRTRPGEISRDGAWHAAVHAMRERPSDGFSPVFHLAHRDGYAAYRIKERWEGRPANVMELMEFVPATGQAHLDLWATLLGVDLVGGITVRNLPADEALPYLLTDSRAFGTSVLKDGLWAKVLDPAVAFGSRTYGTTDRLVVEADGQRWAIESDGTESSCRRVRTKPDLTMDAASLGALVFGGVRPSTLAGGRRLTAASEHALRRGDAFFVVGPSAHCSTWF
jgi:predicted acetyltransferase